MVDLLYEFLRELWQWLLMQCMEYLYICSEVFQASSSQGGSHAPTDSHSVLHPQQSKTTFDACGCFLIYSEMKTNASV